MDDETINLRVRAMDFAIAARSSAAEDIIDLAERIYTFLVDDTLMPIADAKKYAADVLSDCPPPIPHQDLGKADQSQLLDAFRRSVVLASTAEGDLVIDDDAKTRIVRPVA